MIAICFWSDHIGNRGWPTQIGWLGEILGFAIYLGVPATNHAARFAALILAEAGHYSEFAYVPFSQNVR